MACRFALWTMLLAALGGCRGAAPEPSAPRADVLQVAAVEPLPDSYTITFTTFIPANHVPAPRLHPQSYHNMVWWWPPKYSVFAGDDRDFDVDAPRFRSRQIVTIVPTQTDEVGSAFVAAKQNLGGVTESFPASVVEDGRIDEADRELVNSIDHRRRVDVAVDGMIIDDPIRLGPHAVSVRLRTASTGGPRDQLIAGAPSIDWDLTVTIDASGPESKYTVVGKWDGYPACELYINRHPAYQSSPGRATPSTVDLLKLLPTYGDVDVNVSGVLPR